MSALLTWILAASSTLAPARDHDRLGSAIANTVEVEAPLFKDDDDRRRTAALLIAIAFRESSLNAKAVGDMHGGKPTSFCAFQIHLPYGNKTAEGWSASELLDDANKCVTSALHMLRTSIKVCSQHPVAWYAEGPPGCTSPRAQSISRDRMALAHQLVTNVPFAPDEVAAKGLTMMWSLRRDAPP
jgi:hypothetical protein